LSIFSLFIFYQLFVGVLSEAEPPLPIPNREVKRFSAYDTQFSWGQWVDADD
jgi:hypothetical protein